MAMFGERSEGFRCSDVTPDLLAEEANGIPRFPDLKKKEPDAAARSDLPDPSSADDEAKD